MEIRKYGRVSSQAVQQQPAVLDTIVKVNTSAAKNKYMFYEIVNDNDFIVTIMTKPSFDILKECSKSFELGSVLSNAYKESENEGKEKEVEMR